MTNIENTIKDIVVKVLHCDKSELTPQATWKDLKADSLDMVQILIALEEAFNIEIPDEEAEKLQNIEDIMNYVNQNAATV